MQVSEAIRHHDKLVLVCSEQSITLPNVAEEILEARDRERRTGQQKLFPVRVDGFILSSQAVEVGGAKARADEWAENWITGCDQMVGRSAGSGILRERRRSR